MRWPWKKPQKRLDDFIELQEKIPRKCAKILKELERAAPDPVHIKDLAYRCNLSAIEIGSYISSYSRFFKHVEKIESKDYTKFRLNIMEKYTPAPEAPPTPIKKFFLRITIRRR